MKKSFKKAVAVLLAVLMVAFSVPFTALAAPGDYQPDIRLAFGTFHADTATDWRQYDAAAGQTFTMCSLYDVPLDYDAEAGTLTLSAAKAEKACEVLGSAGFTAPEEDITYGVGDYFTVTSLLTNVDTLSTFQTQIAWSDNVEPAGYYSYRNGRVTTYALGTVSEAEAVGGTFSVGGTDPFPGLNAPELYDTINIAGDPSYMYLEDSYFEDLISTSKDTDISSYYDEYFANPETGELTGYEYTNTLICHTWVFKIVDEGPVNFTLRDPNNTYERGYEGGLYVYSRNDGIMLGDITTYAPNYCAPGTNTPTDQQAPGSCKMTFMGENIHTAPAEPDQYTVKFVNAAGDTVSEQAYDAGTAAKDVVVPENTAATSTEKGHTTYTWPEVTDVNGDATYNEIANGPVAHDWVKDAEASTEPTCTQAGHYVYKCTVGGETYDEYPEATGHNWSEYVYNNDATCTADGTETATCLNGCGETLTRTAEGTKLEHSFTDYVYNNDATCTEDGTETATCDMCGEATDTRTAVGTALGHDWGEWVVTKQPSYDEAGEETRTCKNDPSHTETRPIAALKGVSVTVEAVDLGTATVNDNAVTAEDVTINVATNSDVTLTATPIEGAEFVGWEVNGKFVSTEATYTAKALANIVYTPVFQLVEDEVADNEFTVIFADKFGNVVDAQTVTNGADIVVPAVPAIAGYNAIGWSLSDEEIDALTATTTITPKYERITEVTYTVTADGATITTPYATTEDVNTGIGYNTLVTVTAPGATAWKMGESTVAYGETYSFYIGTDMDLTPVYDVVPATPTVVAVSVSEITSGSMKGASFLATREMTDDCEYVNAGYIYGKDLADQEITLADVDGSTVKAIYCATDANQFALNYGITAQTGTIVARAFLAYVDAEGATQVVYAAPQTYAY